VSAPIWTLTIRTGSQVEHEQFETLELALAALERRVAELTPAASREEVQFLRRRFEPARQVTARLEIARHGGLRGSVRGGVDLRGDGSTEAFTGRVRRALIEQRRGESATDALRRALAT